MSEPVKIHLATDHAGFERKQEVLDWLEDSLYEIKDHGATQYHPLDDFPDFIALAAREVSKSPKDTRAIIFGGSGQGEAMLANRYPGVRATVYYGGNLDIIKLSRQHNDANVLSIGAKFVSLAETKECVLKWLATKPLPDDKYQRRNQKIEKVTRLISE